MRNNKIIDTDSYKLSHWLQREKNIQNMMYYIEARYHDGSLSLDDNMASSHPTQNFDLEAQESWDYSDTVTETVFFGLQAYLIEYLKDPITMEDINEAEHYFKDHGPVWNREGWIDLLNKHDGFFPLKIKAVPEGTKVPLSNALVTIESTDPEFNWLIGYIETALVRMWYPITVATLSNLIKQDFVKYWKVTSDSPIESLEFKLHDFGSRGVSSRESAMIGGAAHLVNFQGSDTCIAMPFVQHYYYGSKVAFSVNAAEHSTILPYGRDNEAEAYRHIIETFAKNSIVSIVSDSYDHWHAIKHIFGGELKEQVVNSGGLVVIRPDSGDPTTVVLRTIDILMEKFGHTVNSKGYKVLPDYIRVIQGDGVNRASINQILEAMRINKFSIDNISFGMGGALLQKVNRDTFGFAMKPCAIERNGVWEDCNKNPIDMPEKASKGGRLDLVKSKGKIKTVKEGIFNNSLLKLVYQNGIVRNLITFEEVRKNVNK